MKNILKVALFCCLAGSLGGCASSMSGLTNATATNLKTPVSSVSVSDVDRGLTTVNWKAEVKGENYECNSDDMVRNVNCVVS